jgi:pimeloyl-ACP methyl ester carboxylesterase
MRLVVSLVLGLAVLVAGLAVLVDRLADHRENLALTSFPPEGQILTVNGIKVHAWVRGTGPDLVLIHGAGGNLRDFTFDFAGLLTHRYRVIAFDRPGAGYTDRVRDDLVSAFSNQAESPAEQAALLQAAAAQLGAERPIVLGYSYGGAVAMAWALNHPDSIAGLVDLSGATMPWPGGLDRFYTVMGSAVGGAIMPPLISAFASDRQVQDTLTGVFAPNPVTPDYSTLIGADLSLRRGALRANARQVNTLLPHVRAMSEGYASLTIPVEIVHGDADQIVPIAIHSIPLSKLIPGAHLTILPGVGHMPHHVAPGAVVDAIDRVAARATLR